MPDALLLSPDDQAVSAITGVLEEMSVACERPLDGVSAAQKLNSQKFDLVLVDCENLPAAKLIFDVCRRGKGGINPVPIAIVDGRVGLPTAFRLGAELILTKPVAKDQARTTIRAAVSRLRRELPIESVVPLIASSGIVIKDAVKDAAVKDGPTAQSAGSVPDLDPGFVRGAVPPSYLSAALAASLSAKTRPAITQPAAVPARENAAATGAPSTPATPMPPLSDSSSQAALKAPELPSKTPRPVNPDDDLVLAELNRTELAASQAPELKLEPASNPATASPSFYQQAPMRRRTPLLAFLMMLCAGGGFYAVWTYQPGFREMAEPKIHRWIELSRNVLPLKWTSLLAHLSSPAPPLQKINSAPHAVPDSGNATTTPPATVPSEIAQATPQPPTKATTPGTPSVSSIPAGKADQPAQAVPSPSVPQLPGEDSAVILSSKGAEKRLAHRVSPQYPADLGPADAQGTVVLKTVVNANGEVEAVRLVDGNAVLANAAMAAVKQWRYRPYLRDGNPLPFQTIVIIDFQRP